MTRISEIIRSRDDLLWVDVSDPEPEDERLLAEEFGFHPLAIEDAVRHHQRPKTDMYDGFIFIVFYALHCSDAGTVHPAQVALFVGRNYVVTVHPGHVPELEAVRQRWCSNVNHLSRRRLSLLVHAILDTIVDGYFPVIDAVSERIEDVEARIFERFDPESQREVFGLKKELLEIRRVVAPGRDALNVLLRRDSPVFDEEAFVYFQDVYDHVLRIVDAVDVYRDLLSSALDAYLSVTSNRLNQIMKTLTASSIILMSMTLVASVYGMNFEHIPELHWQFGYAWALGLMAIIGGSLVVLFRRINWL
ncbi:MAG: magnesium transport protein CorA [Thermomicrobiales bacterium]|nr:MAG: magnesium transport protein CorA [Thermomicrobiales bacterium]